MQLSKQVVFAFGTICSLFSSTIRADPLPQLAVADSYRNNAIHDRDASNNTATSTAGEDDDDAADFAAATNSSGPLQLPVIPGLKSTPELVPSRPAIQPVVAPAESDLTSREVTQDIWLWGSNGSFTTRDNMTINPIPAGKAAMQQLFQNAEAWAWKQYEAGELGGEINHAYFRYSSNNLSLVAIAYGAGANGTDPINWGDYSGLAGYLYNLTLDKFDDSDSSLSGKIELEDHTPIVDFTVTYSFGDVDASNQTSYPVTNQTALTESEIKGDGGRRLAKRVMDRDMGQNYILRIRTSRFHHVRFGLIAQLVKQVYSKIIMDSGLSPTYKQLVDRANLGEGFEGFPGNDIQFVALEGGIARSVLEQAITTLMGMAISDDWTNKVGWTRALYGEIINSAGVTIAHWSLGVVLKEVLGCYVRNPDGSHTLGCFIRDEL
ncbi:hypothetical protein MMC09_000547 [Bachmanniomyces sp. S44760]|nr:hypothetical protein [Bachmanniomyces sp. S44760]